jgi:23S rRNA-/tRNA-specific pseudouridylate synthase
LLIDELYSQADAFYLSSVKRKYQLSKLEDEKPLVSRLTLHAKRLEFMHPSGKLTIFESELPKDLRALRSQLQKIA